VIVHSTKKTRTSRLPKHTPAEVPVGAKENFGGEAQAEVKRRTITGLMQVGSLIGLSLLFSGCQDPPE
jgi:hypothetical protein